MARTAPFMLAVAFSMLALALALSIVIWPAVPASAKIAFFALGFAAGAATVRYVAS